MQVAQESSGILYTEKTPGMKFEQLGTEGLFWCSYKLV